MEDQKVEICHGPWAMAHHYPFRFNLGKVISKVPFVIMSGLPPFLGTVINSGMGSHCCASTNNLLTASLMQLSLSKSNVQPVLY